MEQRNSTVLLTGVTGFLGSHTAIQLLEEGYAVVGTLRDNKRAPHIRTVIERHTSNIDRLEFAELILLMTGFGTILCRESITCSISPHRFPGNCPTMKRN